MILNTFDTRNVLSRYAQCSSFVLGPNDPGQTNDAILNDNVVGKQIGPGLPSEFRNELLPNSPIIYARRWFYLQRRQALEQIAPCHNANKLAISYNRYTLD